MRKKILMILTSVLAIGLVVYVGNKFTTKETNIDKTVENTSFSNAYANKTLDEMENKKVIDLISKELKNKNYKSTGIIMYSLGENDKQNEMTIPISKNEYKGEKTKQEIDNIINKILQENGFSKFKVSLIPE
ncbi:hypothetical protein [Bacillus sp. JJ722]|uniref:hypothetical protein n=1 Tax=Bacillus sp. JJ722 TaxID=3122973 RepID=UPI002FFDE95C